MRVYEYNVLDKMDGKPPREIESGAVEFVLDAETSVRARIVDGEIELYVNNSGNRGQVVIKSKYANMVRVGVVDHDASPVPVQPRRTAHAD